MRSCEGMGIEDSARERGPELARAAADAGATREPGYDFSPVRPLMVREASVFPMPYDTARSDGYAPLVERLFMRVRHVMYALDEQRHEIVRLRENTRQVLARLGATG